MIETIMTSIAVGTIWFWVIVAITSIFFIVCIEHDIYAFPFLGTLMLGIVYWKFIMSFGWQTIILCIISYILIGTAWSVFRWYRYIKKTISNVVKEYKGRSNEEAIQALYVNSRLNPGYNRERIIGWIMWWPWSMVWFLLGDFFNTIYDYMLNAYQKIVERAISKAKEDLIKR